VGGEQKEDLARAQGSCERMSGNQALLAELSESCHVVSGFCSLPPFHLLACNILDAVISNSLLQSHQPKQVLGFVFSLFSHQNHLDFPLRS
jgi:hypothetical protein